VGWNGSRGLAERQGPRATGSARRRAPPSALEEYPDVNNTLSPGWMRVASSANSAPDRQPGRTTSAKARHDIVHPAFPLRSYRVGGAVVYTTIAPDM